MDKLLEIKEMALKAIELGHPDPEYIKAANVALKAVDAVSSNKSLGDKAQTIADELLPLIQTLPPVQSYAAIIALLEPHLGDAIDWLGQELAPIKVVDKQDGPVVHDDGQDAPLV